MNEGYSERNPELEPIPDPEASEEGMPKDVNLTDADSVVAYMDECTTNAEWNKRTDEVLAAHDGQYPYWWGDRIAASPKFMYKKLA